MDDVRQHNETGGCSSASFELFAQETQELTQEPTGVGLDVPAWLLSLEQEVDTQLRLARHAAQGDEWRVPLAQRTLTPDDVRGQLTGWEVHPH